MGWEVRVMKIDFGLGRGCVNLDVYGIYPGSVFIQLHPSSSRFFQ